MGYISTKRPGDKIQVTIDREGEMMEVPVILKERQTLVIPELGLEVKNLNKEDQKKFKTKKGVKIIGVPETYRGYDLEGKVLLAVENNEIDDISDAKNLFSNISKYSNTSITIINEKGERVRRIFQ